MKKRGHVEIECVHFNDDAGCVAIGSSDGRLRILREQSLKVLYERNVGETITSIAMLGRSSLVAIAGSALNSTGFSKRKIRMLNTKNGEILKELSFKTAILNIELNVKCLAVVLENKIALYDTRRLHHLRDVSTTYNPWGLGKIACISSRDNGEDENTTLLVYPAEKNMITTEAKGLVGVLALGCSRTRIVSTFKAHDSNISTISVCNQIKAMATASEKGTLVRVFRIPSGEIMHTFRRGSVVASIRHLRFSPEGTFVVACSSNCTIHVFDLRSLKKKQESNTTTSKLAARCFARARLHSIPMACSFLAADTKRTRSAVHFYVITESGRYVQYKFDRHLGGDCTRGTDEAPLVVFSETSRDGFVEI